MTQSSQPSFIQLDTADPQQLESAVRMLLAQASEVAMNVPDGRADYLHLLGWVYAGHVETPAAIHIIAVPITKPANCPRCGCFPQFIKANGKTPCRTLYDAPKVGKPVRIYFQRQRYLCRRCGAPFQQPVESVDDKRFLTSRLVEMIKREASKTSKTFAQVGAALGIGEQTVRNVFTDYGIEKIRQVRFKTPCRLGIDGVYLAGKQRCNITDLDTGRAIELLPECNSDAVNKYLLQLPNAERVCAVAIDMSRMFARVVRERLPHAEIVVDTFHVQRMANQDLHNALRAMRKRRSYNRLRAEWRESFGQKPKRTRFILFKRSSDLKSREKEMLARWFEEIPGLALWYELKEKFLNIFQLRDRRRAEVSYERWESRVNNELPIAFIKLRKTIREWHHEVFNYFEERLTNALTESVNNCLKTMQRQSRGSSFDVLRVKLLYGEDDVPRRRRSSTKRRRRGRGRRQPVNPNSNGQRLRRAYEAQDKTKGLVADPATNESWAKRFVKRTPTSSAEDEAGLDSARGSQPPARPVQGELF